MNELFERFFLCELYKAGFLKAVYDKKQERVIISPKYERLFVTSEDGEYPVHYNEESKHLVPPIRFIIKMSAMMAAMWEQAPPMDISDVARFRKLLECNGIVLAARDDGNNGLHFVTWQYTYKRQGVGTGHYTNDFSGAMQDFVKRSGLMPEELIFDNAQLGLISSAFTYRLENDVNLQLEDEQKIEEILSNLESVAEKKRS